MKLRFSQKIPKDKMSSLAWIVMPILVVWISTNYLMGALKQPSWEKSSSTQPSFAQSEKKNIQAELPQYHWKKTGLVSFWFDDAWLSQYTAAFPILESYNFPASLAVPTRLIGSDAYMTWPQIKRLQYKGWEIDAHSRNHNCVTESTPPTEVESEIKGAKLDLEAEGISPQIYVTPCGAESPLARDLIKKNYLSLRTATEGFNDLPLQNSYNIAIFSIEEGVTTEQVKEWVQEAKNSNKWIILMFHQVTYEKSRFSVTPEKLTEIVEIVKNSGLPVVLPQQVLEMVIDKMDTTVAHG